MSIYYINSRSGSYDNLDDYFFFGYEEEAYETSSTVSVHDQAKQLRQTVEEGPVFEIPDDKWRERLIRGRGDRYPSLHSLKTAKFDKSLIAPYKITEANEPKPNSYIITINQFDVKEQKRIPTAVEVDPITADFYDEVISLNGSKNIPRTHLTAEPVKASQVPVIEKQSSVEKKEMGFFYSIWAFLLDLFGYGELNQVT